MPRYAHSQTITVVRPGTVDPFGDPTGPAIEFTVEDVVSYPTSSTAPSSESNQNETTVVTGYTLLPPPGSDIRATDRVRLAADPAPPEGTDPYEAAPWGVRGDLGEFSSPFTGWTPGGIVLIERVH